jgi:hypothetical protein
VDAVLHVKPAIEVEQVRAATKQHVLAVIDCRPSAVGGVQWIGRSAAAEKRACFKQGDFVPNRSEGGGGG